MAVATVALLVVSFTTLAVAQRAGEATSTSAKGVDAAATVAYWTPERMAAAVPMKIERPNTGAVRMAAPAMASGAPHLAGGYSAETGKMNEDATASLDANVPLDGSYPGPNDTFYVGNPKGVPAYNKYPIKTVGKLYFTDPHTGNGFQCTATVTTGNAKIKNVIWTAGHCVANGGQSYFYSNFLFCPEYNNGNTPVGCWSWAAASVFTVWFNNGDLTRDEGVIALQNTGTVKLVPVAAVTGGLGFAWNWPRDQHWFHFGYPCVAPWDCVHIVETAAEHRYDVNIGGSGPFVNSWGSGQNEGSSGSAVQLFHSDTGGYINSNVSFYFSSGPNGNEHNIELQGPYYDTSVCSVLWKPFTGFTGTC
jgi:V8-like Glu-specific endopeptidase